jgi:HD-like signal output (HDOD) protein
MQSYQYQWGINQWVEYLKDKETPVLPSTWSVLAALREASEEERDSLSALDMTNLVYADPYLALKLLRRAEQRRSRQLGHDTTTPLAAILQTGYDEMQEIVADSPPDDATLPGCRRCEYRAVIASGIARAWANRRIDVSPDEVAMAALLAETGELLLWHFAPEMTAKETVVRDWNVRYPALMPRPSEIDFTFRKLTMALAQSWELPNLVIMLIKGTDSPRANIARLATDIAKSLADDPEPEALFAIIRQANAVIPAATPHDLADALPLTDDIRDALFAVIAASSPSSANGGA